MSFAIPIYHWFHNGNPYSGAEGGMRYIIEPGKRPRPPTTRPAKRRSSIWLPQSGPAPGSREHTAEEKQQSAEFAGDQAGLDTAIAWLQKQHEAQKERWENIPSILDCEPDR